MRSSNKNKSQTIKNSIMSLVALLNDILKHPEKYVENHYIRQSLNSQGGMASIDHDSNIDDIVIQIRPMSLTTLKSKISTYNQDVSFEFIDSLRLDACDAIDRVKQQDRAQKKPTKLGLQEQIVILKSDLESQREANFHLLQALSLSMSSISNIQNEQDQNIRKKLGKDATDSILRILTLKPRQITPPPNTSNIVTLKNDDKK
ncbi:hypothetical protein SAMN04489798_3072 [Pseudomonas arsenicoxydans]|uniref:Uncharacterized protein n=1 Tax=Pseudomonas arsenicoxydans TaxID=702115 RepID=A0A1H0JXC5_9PSED|nr:hypothetical protein [Pseudomonas arsenicoxydans]SDO48336.1 hypothetical protein SAMN04489798_3072 [Pseudomonas arsenicoxydans]